MSLMLGQQLVDALREAGLADDQTRRVVLDMPVDGPAVAHVEKFVDERVFQVVNNLEGVQIVRADG